MLQRFHVGPRLSEYAIFNQVVYLAGQVPKDATGGIEAQTQSVLNQIEKLLIEAGSDKSRILTCQIFLKDIQDIQAMNKVWDTWVVQGQTPPRATVQAAMADPNWLIEIVVSAALQ